MEVGGLTQYCQLPSAAGAMAVMSPVHVLYKSSGWDCYFIVLHESLVAHKIIC